ncbi:MAG: type II secretion system protein GspN [Alphaproteobacteria bacterium]
MRIGLSSFRRAAATGAPATANDGSSTAPRARGRSAAWSALFALGVFLVALAWTLPHDLIARRAVEAASATAPVAIDFDAVSWAFPVGWRVKGLRVSPTKAPESTIAFGETTLRTPLTGLLLGRPESGTIDGRLWEGTLTGSVARDGAKAHVDLDLDGADLARALGALVPPPARFAGRANLALDLAGDGRTTATTEGTLRLDARGLEIHELLVRGFPIPDLAFRDVVVAAQMNGSRLQVKDLRAEGDQLSVEGSGDVVVREPVAQSSLNLKLSIQVPPDAPPALRVATALLPKRPAGEKPVYTLTGTLASPVLR